METRIRQTLAALFDNDVATRAGLKNLGGHASLRIYWRITLPDDLTPPRAYPRGESTLMAMVLPEGVDPLKSAEGSSSKAARPKELPFVDVQRFLANLGMPVPAIDVVDMPRGVLLLEDLGDELFEDAVLVAGDKKGRRKIYGEAIDLLIHFQSAVLNHPESKPGQTIAFERSFDAELLRWELDHYLEWGLHAQLGEQTVAPFEDTLTAGFERIVDELLDLKQTLVLRDFQSRNIMRKQGNWILIDFQDALLGPFIYDLVALLRDSYIDLAPDEVEVLLGDYIDAGAEAGLPWCDDARGVRRAFYLQTVQRKLKDAGRFIYIDRVKENPSFLDYYGPSVQYVRDALEHLDDFEDFAGVLAEVEPAF